MHIYIIKYPVNIIILKGLYIILLSNIKFVSDVLNTSFSIYLFTYLV